MKSKKKTNRRNAVTMADVAERANVSLTTVSFVLSENSDVSISDETKRRVHEASNELGYRRNAAARALASRRTSLLGIVSDVVFSPFGGEAIIGAQDEARSRGLQLLMSAYDEESLSNPYEPLLDRQVEALAIMMTTHRSIEVPTELGSIPTVLVNCFDESGTIASITPDEQLAGRDATEYLISCGHERIGLINLEPDRVAAIGRRMGYEQALASAGLELDPRLIVEGDADARAGYADAKVLLGLEKPPTAIFCATDRKAMGAYDAIKETGLRIPEDISIMGFDDQQIITEYLRPPLTTMRLPFREMAQRAVEVLADKLASDAAPLTSERINCQLVKRESVGPPRDTRIELAPSV